jgi:hypothetical protein
MDPNLEKKLTDKYPKIFAGKDKPITESLIPFGLECGDGWYKIIDALCQSIQNHVDSDYQGCLVTGQVEALQVKEKFGGLRFYISGGDGRVYGMIEMAETLSRMTCEHCGKDGKVRGKGWIYTLCDECNEKRKKG